MLIHNNLLQDQLILYYILCSGTVDRWGKSQNCYFEYIHEHELWLGESNSIFNVLLGGPQQFLKHLSLHIFMIAI